MNMVLKDGFLDPRVSLKGWDQLFREDAERANQARWRTLAGKDFASDSGMATGWFCLAIDIGREKTVEHAMISQGIEAIVPMRMGPQRRRHHKVIPPSSMPVMSGYVMVRCVLLADALHGLMSFNHVRGVVGGCMMRFSISDEKMKRFMDMAASGLFDWEKPAGLFQPYTKVEITEGPFVGFVGPIVSFAGAGKGDAVVEIEIFGRTSTALIPLAMLLPV